jgi:copper chaperone
MPEIKVKGMSCGHCAAAVTRALENLPGVSQVQVDLANGRVTFQSQGQATGEQVAQAVKAAGYEVVAG